jgi:hypothetical protein
VQPDIKSKRFQIADVSCEDAVVSSQQTYLNQGVGVSGRNSKRVKVKPDSVLTNEFTSCKLVLDDLSSAPFEMPVRPCLGKKLLGDRRSV